MPAKGAGGIPDRLVQGLERKSKTQDHGRSGGGGQANRIVKEIALDGDAAANGPAFAFCKGILNFRTPGVVFHRLRVGLRVRQNLAPAVMTVTRTPLAAIFSTHLCSAARSAASELVVTDAGVGGFVSAMRATAASCSKPARS